MDNQLVITFDADLVALSMDELVALNQDMGRHIDNIREYRRTINKVLSDKQIAASIAAKLTLEERKALGIQDVIVTPEAIIGSLKAGE